VGDIPHADGLDRGWADRFALGLDRLSPGLLYANLAIRGRCIAPIRDEQLAPALALKPDLVSVLAGANDLIRPGFDLDFTLEVMDSMQAAFREAGATVLTITYPWRSGYLLSERAEAFNQGLRDVARKNGALLLDLATIPSTVDPRLWCHDRLHLNPEGHNRLARAMLALLEAAVSGSRELTLESASAQAQGTPDWATELPAPPVLSRRTALRRDLGWTFRYLIPWAGRRLTGRSSGDGRSAKRPELAPAADLAPAAMAESGMVYPRP
jgi:lysophospholipase L1-like esterase